MSFKYVAIQQDKENVVLACTNYPAPAAKPHHASSIDVYTSPSAPAMGAKLCLGRMVAFFRVAYIKAVCPSGNGQAGPKMGMGTWRRNMKNPGTFEFLHRIGPSAKTWGDLGLSCIISFWNILEWLRHQSQSIVITKNAHCTSVSKWWGH